MKALLVDLDDTLLDYSRGIDASWREACEAMCAPCGVDPWGLPEGIAAARRWFWDESGRHREGRRDMLRAWAIIAARALEHRGAPNEALAQAIAEDYRARRRAAYCLLPGAVEALAELRRRGMPLALVTNGDSREQRFKIERFDLARYFDVIVVEGEFGAGKPEEAVYRHAMAELKAVAATTWMIGDHLEWDVGAPQRLGLTGVWVDGPGLGLPGGSAVTPHHIVRSFGELLSV